MKLRALLICASIAISSMEANAMSLGEAVRLAVNENPAAKADKAGLKVAASQIRESQAGLGPTVDLFGDIGRQRRISPTASSVSGASGTLTSREIGVRASLLLFDGYERANTIYRSAARFDAAAFRLLSTSETLALSAVEAYVDVLRHRRLVGATHTNIRRHQEILRQIRERVAGGNAPASDRIQIEERVFAAKAVAVEVKNALQDAEDKYKKVIGRSAGKKLRVPGVKDLPRSKGSLVSASIANNYSLRQADKQVNELGYSKEIAKAGSLPRLSLDGRASAGDNRNGTAGDESDLFLGLTLSWRLYDGGVTQARERTFAEQALEAEFRKDVLSDDIAELAKRVWNAAVNGRKRQSLVGEQLSANKRIVNNYREEYELSKRSLLDVLDAERARFNNEFQLISIQAATSFTSYRMLASMSKLASHFGLLAENIAPSPTAEEQFTAEPTSIFNVTIEPLQ